MFSSKCNINTFDPAVTLFRFQFLVYNVSCVVQSKIRYGKDDIKKLASGKV